MLSIRGAGGVGVIEEDDENLDTSGDLRCDEGNSTISEDDDESMSEEGKQLDVWSTEQFRAFCSRTHQVIQFSRTLAALQRCAVL